MNLKGFEPLTVGILLALAISGIVGIYYMSGGKISYGVVPTTGDVGSVCASDSDCIQGLQCLQSTDLLSAVMFTSTSPCQHSNINCPSTMSGLGSKYDNYPVSTCLIERTDGQPYNWGLSSSGCGAPTGGVMSPGYSNPGYCTGGYTFYCKITAKFYGKTCQGYIAPICGNSKVETGEQCDPSGSKQTTSDGGVQTCTSQCTWGSVQYFCSGQPVSTKPICVTGSVKSCTMSDGRPGQQTCLTDCSGYSSCVSTATCSPGQQQSCGNCGNQVCGSDGNWATCTNQGICKSGASESKDCQYLGTQTRTCNNVCQWTSYDTSRCSGECIPTTVKDCTISGVSGKQTCQSTYTYGSCVANNAVFSFVDLIQFYPTAKPFSFTVSATNFPTSGSLNAEILSSNGQNIQTLFGSPLGNNAWKFDVSVINAGGTYTIKVSGYNSITGTTQTATATFVIRSVLVVDLSIEDYVQYTTEDVFVNARINPIGCGAGKTFVAERKNAFGIFESVPVTPSYQDAVGTTCKIRVPKEQLTQIGIYNFRLTASDPQNFYDQSSDSVENVQIVRPAVSISLEVPATAKANSIINIVVHVYGVKSLPIDPDRILLTVTLPNNNKQTFETNQFTKMGSGEYMLSYTPTLGQLYYIKVDVFKSGYDSNSAEASMSVSGGGTVEVCGNGIDDDGNGLIDGQDPVCQNQQVVCDGILIGTTCLGYIPLAVIVVIFIVVGALVARSVFRK